MKCMTLGKAGPVRNLLPVTQSAHKMRCHLAAAYRPEYTVEAAWDIWYFDAVRKGHFSVHRFLSN